MNRALAGWITSRPIRRFPRRLWSRLGSSGLADEAAEREEYGLADRGRTELERERLRAYEIGEGASAALDELDEFKPPSS